VTSPYYVSPEQIMRDKSDYARKGIARGRSVLVMTYADGILFCGENPSKALHKISEIYDRIAFAAVGKYNEFENLRQAGVRYADLRGYQYDRSDVTSRGLANAYAQTLGTIFTESGKPYEVELTVAEVGDTAAGDQLYRLTYDGSVAEEHGFVVMGGSAEPIAAVQLAVKALRATTEGAESRDIHADGLEAAVLDRTRPRRAFKRLSTDRLTTILGA
jgi:proteasome alpha subunit